MRRSSRLFVFLAAAVTLATLSGCSSSTAPAPWKIRCDSNPRCRVYPDTITRKDTIRPPG